MAFADVLQRELKRAIRGYLGVSVFEPEQSDRGGYGPDIDDEQVIEARRAIGGNIQPLPTTRLRWYIADLESAQVEADAGFLREAARLGAAMRRDGTIDGLMQTRCSGLVHLPKRFYGSTEVTEVLRAKNGSRSVFDEMCPPPELALLHEDGVKLGIGVAELVPVQGRSYPVLVRLEPEFLTYRWTENKWYYSSAAGGVLPINPGDGRWVLHLPGGRLTPWRSGRWPALGRAFINKEHAISMRSNYSGKLANPARVAVAPAGATEAQRVGFFKRVLAWAANTVLEVPPGWDVKLVESNGRGWEVFQKQIDASDQEAMIAITGQMATTTGGSGFANLKYPDAIRRDLVKADAEGLAYTIYTQVLPKFVVDHWGMNALEMATVVEWDTGTPADRETESRTLTQAGAAIKQLTEALAPHKRTPEVGELAQRFGVPTREITDAEAKLLMPAPGNEAREPKDDNSTKEATGR